MPYVASQYLNDVELLRKVGIFDSQNKVVINEHFECSGYIEDTSKTEIEKVLAEKYTTEGTRFIKQTGITTLDLYLTHNNLPKNFTCRLRLYQCEKTNQIKAFKHIVSNRNPRQNMNIEEIQAKNELIYIQKIPFNNNQELREALKHKFCNNFKLFTVLNKSTTNFELETVSGYDDSETFVKTKSKIINATKDYNIVAPNAFINMSVQQLFKHKLAQYVSPEVILPNLYNALDINENLNATTAELIYNRTLKYEGSTEQIGLEIEYKGEKYRPSMEKLVCEVYSTIPSIQNVIVSKSMS